MPNTTTYDSSAAQDALNLAAAYIVKVTSKTNELLTQLRKNQIVALNKLVEAMYSSAKAILWGAVCEALMNFAMAAGGLDALKDADAAQNGLKEVQQQEKNLQQDKTNLENKLAKENFKPGENKESVQSELDKKVKELSAKQKEKQAKETSVGNKSQRATMKSQCYSSAAPAIAALPRASQEAIKNQADAVQQIMSQINQMLSSSYDKSNSVIQSFLNMNNLISSIAGLNQIQLR